MTWLRLLTDFVLLLFRSFLITPYTANDLDVMTLSKLEACMMAFPGVSIVVSHDRSFLDKVATHILAFPDSAYDKQGRPNKVEFYTGNYSDFLDYKQHKYQEQLKAEKKQAAAAVSSSSSSSNNASSSSSSSKSSKSSSSGEKEKKKKKKIKMSQ